VLDRRNDRFGTHIGYFPSLWLVLIDSPGYSLRREIYSAARWVQPSFGAAVRSFSSTSCVRTYSAGYSGWLGS
jgi:hypothetical protein